MLEFYFPMSTYIRQQLDWVWGLLLLFALSDDPSLLLEAISVFGYGDIIAIPITSLLLVSCLHWWCNLCLIYCGLLFCCFLSVYQILFFINSCIQNKVGSFLRHYWLIRYDIYLSIFVPYIDYFYIGVLNLMETCTCWKALFYCSRYLYNWPKIPLSCALRTSTASRHIAAISIHQRGCWSPGQ